MTKSKKVVLLIVEGFSEEVLLHQALRTRFKQHDIRFEIQRGDILFDFKKNRGSIKSIIGDIVKNFLNKRKFTRKDMLGVLHIIDTDGSLIPNEKVKVESEQAASIWYELDCIKVPNGQQQKSIIYRNEQRSRNIRTMNSVSAVLNNQVSYQMFYFSRNLEHVLFDNPNPDEDTKIEDIEDFIENLGKPLDVFLNEHMYDLLEDTYENRYKKSWKAMDEHTTSLKRMTNVVLLFEYIKNNT